MQDGRMKCKDTNNKLNVNGPNASIRRQKSKTG